MLSEKHTWTRVRVSLTVVHYFPDSLLNAPQKVKDSNFVSWHLFLHFWNSDRNWLQPELHSMKMRSQTLYVCTQLTSVRIFLWKRNYELPSQEKRLWADSPEPQNQLQEASGLLSGIRSSGQTSPSQCHELHKGGAEHSCLQGPRTRIQRGFGTFPSLMTNLHLSPNWSALLIEGWKSFLKTQGLFSPIHHLG